MIKVTNKSQLSVGDRLVSHTMVMTVVTLGTDRAVCTQKYDSTSLGIGGKSTTHTAYLDYTNLTNPHLRPIYKFTPEMIDAKTDEIENAADYLYPGKTIATERALDAISGLLRIKSGSTPKKHSEIPAMRSYGIPV